MTFWSHILGLFSKKTLSTDEIDEFDMLVEELIKIGESGRVENTGERVIIDNGHQRDGVTNPRTIEIGKRLNKMGRIRLMRKAYACVEREQSILSNHALAKAWQGIGGWDRNRDCDRNDMRGIVGPREKARKSLCDAVKRGDMATVIHFLNSGVNVNNMTSEGHTPLTLAAFYGHKDIAEILLKRGANIELESGSAASPLALAAMNGHTQVVELFLKSGALVDSGASKKYKGHQEIRTGLILSMDALNLRVSVDKSGRPMPLQMAVPIILAAEYGHTQTVNLLLEYGAHIDTCTETGETALIQASKQGHLETVKFLIDKGADINASTLDGATALAEATQHGYEDIIRLLLSKGAKQKK